jgi:hypothetical protein
VYNYNRFRPRLAARKSIAISRDFSSIADLKNRRSPPRLATLLAISRINDWTLIIVQKLEKKKVARSYFFVSFCAIPSLPRPPPQHRLP